VEQLGRLNARVEITQRKLTDVAARTGGTEQEFAHMQSVVFQRFGVLWRMYRSWVIETEKAKLLSLMVPGCEHNLSVDFVTLHLKRVAELSELAPLGGAGAEILVGGATRLLEAVSASGWSAVPAYEPPVPEAAAVPDIGLPWLDRGMTKAEIEGELKWIRIEHPELDLAGAYRKLHEKHPELFGPPASDLEFERMTATSWLAEMIGTTTVSAEP